MIVERRKENFPRFSTTSTTTRPLFSRQFKRRTASSRSGTSSEFSIGRGSSISARKWTPISTGALLVFFVSFQLFVLSIFSEVKIELTDDSAKLRKSATGRYELYLLSIPGQGTLPRAGTLPRKYKDGVNGNDRVIAIISQPNTAKKTASACSGTFWSVSGSLSFSSSSH